MQNVISLILSILLMLSSGLSGVEAPTTKNDPQEYSITLRSDTGDIVEYPKSAKAGETVSLHTLSYCDAELIITIDGVEGHWAREGLYQFTMPAHDVVVDTCVSTAGFAGS